jgi:hypothetical protein
MNKKTITILLVIALLAAAGTVSIVLASANDYGDPPAALQPPPKQTALAELQSKRETDNALHPPIIKNDKTPLAGFTLPASCPRTKDDSKTGIVDFRFGPFFGGRYLINWAAAYGSNGDYYNIWAGSPDDDPKKGLLRVDDEFYDSCLAQAKGTPSPGFKDYLTDQGPMKIAEIRGDTVVYSIEGGGTGTFNFVTGQFLP